MNKDPDIVPKKVPMVILDSKSAVCMVNNAEDTKNTIHIAREIHYVRNGENCKMNKIYWCEGGL